MYIYFQKFLEDDKVPKFEQYYNCSSNNLHEFAHTIKSIPLVICEWKCNKVFSLCFFIEKFGSLRIKNINQGMKHALIPLRYFTFHKCKQISYLEEEEEEYYKGFSLIVSLEQCNTSFSSQIPNSVGPTDH